PCLCGHSSRSDRTGCWWPGAPCPRTASPTPQCGFRRAAWRWARPPEPPRASRWIVTLPYAILTWPSCRPPSVTREPSCRADPPGEMTPDEKARVKGMAGVGALQGVAMVAGAVVGGSLSGLGLMAPLIAVPALLVIGLA